MRRVGLLFLLWSYRPEWAPAMEPPRAPVTFRLYSDFTCPFCYVSEQSTVLQLIREYDVILDWRGFELNPSIAPGGITRDELLPGQDVRVLHARVQRFARLFGVRLPDLPPRIPNTRKALAVAEFARDAGRLDLFRHEVLRSYWEHGEDIEDAAVLREAARRAGLDPVRAEGSVYDSKYRRRIEGMSDEAARVGVTGIPTFVFPVSAPLVGCQSWPVLEAAAVASGARRRPDPPSPIPAESVAPPPPKPSGGPDRDPVPDRPPDPFTD